MKLYPEAALERAIEDTGSDFASAGEEDQLDLSGRDHRDQSPADAALATALSGVWV